MYVEGGKLKHFYTGTIVLWSSKAIEIKCRYAEKYGE